MKTKAAYFGVLCCLLGAWACDNSDVETPDGPAYSHESGKITSCSEQIAYEKWTYNRAAEATFVFVNGRRDYTDRYHHLADMLDRPWHIIMFDHYGQGRSDGPRAHADDFDTQHVCDMKRVIDKLADPKLPVAVAAHGMGGLVAARFAQLYPGAADVYALSSPMFGIPTAGVPPETVKALAASMIEQGRGREPFEDAGGPKDACEDNKTTHDCDYYNRWLGDPLLSIGPPTYGWMYAAMTGFERLFADVSEITKPVLILQPGEEYWVTTEEQDRFNRLLPQSTLIKIPNAYHELFNELNKAEVVDIVVNYIDRHIDGHEIPET